MSSGILFVYHACTLVYCTIILYCAPVLYLPSDRIGVPFLAFATVRTKGIPVRKAVSPVAKGRGNVLAILAGIRGVHDTVRHVALAPIKNVSIVRGPFLDAGASIETSVVVSSARDVLDLALQTRVALGTAAVHAVVVQFHLPGEFFRHGIDSGVGSEFSVSVSAVALVVTI